ncbi:hypothetical protein GCM10009821_06960 [Aeromicrobium halocynthiae]|uniref:ABC transporter permease n=1 Tax=Aeromicrobium halocynthiae TaxID=560557 RepID=A0ABN2VT71_9ACTN
MTHVADATAAGLQRVGARPTLGRYLLEVWRRRAFVMTLARFRTQAENDRDRPGIAWVVLRPLLDAGIYGLIFGWVLQTSRDLEDVAAAPGTPAETKRRHDRSR